MINLCNLCTDLVKITDMALPPRDQRHRYLRFERLEYTDGDIIDFEERLGRIYGKEIHRVQVFDFGGLIKLMGERLSGRILMEHRDAQGHSVFTSRARSRLFEIRGPLVHELILEFFSTFRFGEAVLDLDTIGALQFQLGGIPDKGDLSAYWIRISSAGDFLGTTPSYTSITDLMHRLYHRLIAYSIVGKSKAPEKVTVTDLFYLRGMDVGSVNIPYLLARCLRLFASGRKRGAMISGDLPMIDMAELVRLQICEELGNTWALVSSRPEMQQVVAVGAPMMAEDAPVVDEGALAIPAPA
ncbi:hypothetical protein Tco_0015615 [Tanacetum coccineum]